MIIPDAVKELQFQLKKRAGAVVRNNRILRRALGPVIFPTYPAYIISYPKTGRTWLRVMLGKAICLAYDQPDGLMLLTHRLTAAAGLRATRFTHEDAIFDGRAWQDLDPDKRRYAHSRVLLLTRDLKNTLVSSYFHATKRARSFTGTLAEFIRHDSWGAKKIITYYEYWYSARNVPQEMQVLRYEDMYRSPKAALEMALGLAGATGLASSVLDQAVEFGSFDNMKKLEASGYFVDRRMKPRDPSDQSSFKVRQGGSGESAKLLTLDDISYIDGLVIESGCPWVTSVLSAERKPHGEETPSSAFGARVIPGSGAP